MLNSFPVTLIIGTLLGFLSGLGIGGGSLLILWLTLVQGMEPGIARSINLLFFIPSACISCGIRMKQGTLKPKALIPAIVSGCIAAAIFSAISAQLQTDLLKKIFGIILIAAGLRELFYRPRKVR